MIRLVEQPTTKGISLLEQYRATGSPEAFAQIMRAYGGMVFSVCVKVTRDAADAEDASQATFLTLAVQIKTGTTIKYLGPWLKKVAKRSSLDLVRSRKRRSRREAITAENRPEHYGVLPGRRSEETELQQLIRRELDHLPAKYRMPLVLHYFGGLSHEEISREMRCTIAALGVRLHRARKMLGKRLTERGITLESAALGAAIAASVQYYVSDQFVHSTTHAMLTMSTGRPTGMGALALGSHIPPSLGIVPQLVQEIAQSMARVRVRYATAALTLSITCLGGAAEAVRHLPASIRPNLEFLAPSKALENLFRWNVSVPRMQETPTAPEPAPMAQVPSDDAAAGEGYSALAPSLAFTPRPARPTEQLLALRFSTPVPPVSTHTPHLNLKAPSGDQATPTIQTTTLARIDAGKPAPPPRTDPQPRQLGTSSKVGPGSGNDSPRNEPPPLVSPALPPASPHRDPAATAVASYAPPPSALRRSSSNLERVEGVDTLTPMLLGDTDAPVPAGPEQLTLDAFTSRTSSYAMASGQCAADWLTLRPSDIYAHPGNGTYAWSDTSQGIIQGGVNSAVVTLHDTSGFGVLNIEKLANNTTLAPDRPTGHTFIGIWSVNSLLNYSSIDLIVRYDEVLAESLGKREEILKLWIYDGTEWVRIMDSSFGRDLTNHTLTGSWTDGPIEYFGVSAPEPSAVFGLLVGGGAALLRRRRRQA